MRLLLYRLIERFGRGYSRSQWRLACDELVDCVTVQLGDDLDGQTCKISNRLVQMAFASDRQLERFRAREYFRSRLRSVLSSSYSSDYSFSASWLEYDDRIALVIKYESTPALPLPR